MSIWDWAAGPPTPLPHFSDDGAFSAADGVPREGLFWEVPQDLCFICSFFSTGHELGTRVGAPSFAAQEIRIFSSAGKRKILLPHA